MRKGKWSTGADIDRDVVFSKLMSKFTELENHEFANITANAREALANLHESKHLKPNQKKELKVSLDAASIPVA